VIGLGLAGGMAARALYPDRPIILVSGDGSFTFTVAEIERAVHQGLHFVVVLADDQAWGITLTGQMKELGEGVTAELGAIQFAQLAEALGARGVQVGAPQDILPALRAALAADWLTLIHVPVIKSNPTD
jgi:acetolactate synthase-1/2/3 large subunit